VSPYLRPRPPLTVGRRLIVGTPGVVKSEIESVAAQYHADEVLAVKIMHDHAARRRSYDLIGQAFGLCAAPVLAHA
jgi:alkanesulfonate monooxygenase SsuD/methylene tetrahydromethanopterin reductase-like flavin-dependent oxidoreductase (luciferase family)